MKSSFAALTALIAAALFFFTYSPANANMSGLYNAASTAGTAMVHKTGSRFSKLKSRLKNRLSGVRKFKGIKNLEDFSLKGRDFPRGKDCPTGKKLSKDTLNCFLKTENKRFKL